jgi:hypothetical protein
MVTCNICKRDFKKITNSHLRDKHDISLEEYLRLFPGSKMVDELVLKSISESTKGKSYVDRYGKEKAEKLIDKRRKDALKQFENIDQRVLRRNHSWKGHKDISGDLWRVIQQAGKAKGLGFDLTIEFLWDLFEKQKGVCVLSGLPIVLDTALGTLSTHGYQRKTASLDRINSSKGYTKDNVQWVHKDINQMKSSRTDQDFIALCKAVALYNELK